MATEHAPYARVDRGYVVRRIEGASYPLPPRTDEELAVMREQHPDQAWFWTRAFYDDERAAEAETEQRRVAGAHGLIHESTEEFLTFLDSYPAADVPGNAHT